MDCQLDYRLQTKDERFQMKDQRLGLGDLFFNLLSFIFSLLIFDKARPWSILQARNKCHVTSIKDKDEY